MEVSHTKNDLKLLDDRYENFFSLSFETSEMPDLLVEMSDTPFILMRSKLIDENYSLIICLSRLPVYKVLKNAELLEANNSYRLLRISSENYTSEIEDFLIASEYAFSFFWLKDFQKVTYKLPETSQERIRLSNLNNNQIYRFWMENEECTVAVWNGKSGI